MFCYVALFFGGIDFALGNPGDGRGGGKHEKWVFCLMRNAQSE